jgi:ParB-like chromosome segregation protein Spo0J
MPYPDPEANWRPHVARLAELVADGWMLPLLADGRTHVLMDGNHRFGALQLAGRGLPPGDLHV